MNDVYRNEAVKGFWYNPQGGLMQVPWKKSAIVFIISTLVSSVFTYFVYNQVREHQRVRRILVVKAPKETKREVKPESKVRSQQRPTPKKALRKKAPSKKASIRKTPRHSKPQKTKRQDHYKRRS